MCSLDTGIQGASFNVAINLGQLSDNEYRQQVGTCTHVGTCSLILTMQQTQSEVALIVKESEEKRCAILATLKARLKC